MRDTRRLTHAFACAGLIAGALAVALSHLTSGSPALTLRPIIHARDEDRYEAMKSAPVVILGQLANLRVVSYAPTVPKPPDIGGPATPTMPMFLVRMSARVLATLRGEKCDTVEFYFWRYAIGKHGGPRLFDPSPGTGHVLFLREDAGFLRMVGDYPAYDLEISRAFLTEFNFETERYGDLFERIVVAQIGAQLKPLTIEEHYSTISTGEWMGLTSPFFVASTLDSYCRSFPNPIGQIAACMVTAGQFPGRCEGYQRAIDLGSHNSRLRMWLELCRAGLAGRINELR